jgi:hypothetical protein
MHRLFRRSAAALAAGTLLLTACGREPDRGEFTREAIPPGVDVGPPRSAAETGGLILPGRGPAQPGQENQLTDTVGAVVQQPGQVAPAQPGTGPGAAGAPPQR